MTRSMPLLIVAASLFLMGAGYGILVVPPPTRSPRLNLSSGASATLGPDDFRYVATGASTTVTLPSAAAAGAGRAYQVVSGSSSDVEIASTAGNLAGQTLTQVAGVVTLGVNADTTLTLTEQGAGVYCISDGTNWQCAVLGVGVDG